MSYRLFTYPLTIKEAHLDTLGHVNNATYLDLFEEARWELMNENGYGIKQIKESGLGPVILEVKVRFLKELRLHQKVFIETQTISYERKIAKMVQKIFRDKELCCNAEFIFALFDVHQRKLVLPTPEWLQAIGYVPEK